MLRIHNLTVSYQRHPALHHIHAEFSNGSLTAIVGPNGAGKSTLLKAIAGMVNIEQGQVDLPKGQPAFAYLPQQTEIDRTFPFSVLDFVQMGCWQHIRWYKRLGLDLQQRAKMALERVGLAELQHRSLSSLSVGQFQRVLFARLMLQDAPLILLDEPFNALDARTTADLLQLVRQWQAEGRTVLAVLHDYVQVMQHFPRAFLIARECLAHGPTSEVLTEANLRRARNHADAWQEDAPVCARD